MTITIAQLAAAIDTDRERETLDSMGNYYNEKDGQDLLTALRDNDSDLRDHINEIADGMTDVYTADLWKWAGNDCGAAIEDLAEEFGGDFISDTLKARGFAGVLMAAQCMQHERALSEDLDAIQKTLEQLDSAETEDTLEHDTEHRAASGVPETKA